MMYLDLQERHFVNPASVRLIQALVVTTAFRENLS